MNRRSIIFSGVAILIVCIAVFGDTPICPQKCRPYPLEPLPIVVNGKYGYIDKQGNIVIKPQYSWAHFFFEGLARVQVKDKIGYIDPSGKLVVNPQFQTDEAQDFSEGLACVKIGNLWGYIDTKGRVSIKPQFRAAASFSEGMASVLVGDSWGYIDKTGRLAISPQFNRALDFSEGLALVFVGNEMKRGFIDKTGKMAIPATFDFACSFLGGLARVGAVDKTGYIEVIYIDKSGGAAVRPQPQGQRIHAFCDFFENLACISTDGGKMGYIDKTGKIVIAPQFDFAHDFSEGLAAVKVADRIGYVDRTGRIAIEPQFSYAGEFVGGIAQVHTPSTAREKIGYIDRKGKYIWRPTR